MHSARASGVIWDLVRIWLLLSLAALLIALQLRPSPSLAQDEIHHAGLIVRDEAGRLTYAWVPFRDEKINGIELLKRSGIPVVTAGFGGLGEAVCSINGQGCGVSQCQRNVCQGSGANSPYWQYFQQSPDDPADWIWQPLGASASDVQDGEVFGWSWTASEPGLPSLPRAEIARIAGATGSEVTEPAVRTVLPEGVATATPSAPPDARTTAIAAGILATIGAAAIALAQRRRAMEAPV